MTRIFMFSSGLYRLSSVTSTHAQSHFLSIVNAKAILRPLGSLTEMVVATFLSSETKRCSHSLYPMYPCSIASDLVSTIFVSMSLFLFVRVVGGVLRCVYKPAGVDEGGRSHFRRRDNVSYHLTVSTNMFGNALAITRTVFLYPSRPPHPTKRSATFVLQIENPSQISLSIDRAVRHVLFLFVRVVGGVLRCVYKPAIMSCIR